MSHVCRLPFAVILNLSNDKENDSRTTEKTNKKMTEICEQNCWEEKEKDTLKEQEENYRESRQMWQINMWRKKNKFVR